MIGLNNMSQIYFFGGSTDFEVQLGQFGRDVLIEANGYKRAGEFGKLEDFLWAGVTDHTGTRISPIIHALLTYADKDTIDDIANGSITSVKKSGYRFGFGPTPEHAKIAFADSFIPG